MADSPEELRRKALETASVVEDALRSIADNIATAFESAMAGADRVSQAVAKDIQSRFNKMAKVTDDLAGNAVKLKQGLLDVRDVNKQILDRQVKQESLGTQLVTLLKQQGIAASNIDDLIQGHLSGTIRLTDEQKTLVEEYIKAKGFNDDYIEQLEEQKAIQDEINAKLGNTGKLVKGISKIPILGNLVDTDETLKAMNQNIAEGGNRTSAMKAGFKNLGSQIKTSLTDPLTVTIFFVTQFVSALKSADSATGDLAKDFNLTYTEASNLREELIQIGNLSGNIALNSKALQESMVAVGKSLGSNAVLNQADLETFTELREMAGYTNEELVDIQKLTLATGGNLKDNTKQFLGTVSALNAQNKLTVNEKQLLKEVSKTSAAIKLSIGGTTENLAKAAFQAKQFGINLDQADKIAESLLDFESSITAELEAELLTGKNLNLERARLLALNGDIAGASAEILKQVKGSAEFTKMNRVQQEALAKAVGMSREDLAASLVEREALTKIGVKDAEAAKEKFDLLVKQYGYDKAVTMLGDEQYANQLKQQSIQERLTNATEKLKELFIGLVQPLMPVLDALASILQIVGLVAQGIGLAGELGKKLGETFGEVGATLGYTLKGLIWAAGALAAMFAYSSLAGIPFVGPVLGAVAAAGVLAFANGLSSQVKIKDGMIGPDGGLLVSGPKGTYSLDKNDSVIAGTNLNKPNTNTTSNANVDLSPLLEEMRATKQELAKANAKPTIIENTVDGTRFGTAIAKNTYKTQ